MATKVTINTDALNINWQPTTDYRLELNEDFVKDTLIGVPNVPIANLKIFNSNDFPRFNGFTLTEFSNYSAGKITITFNRDIFAIPAGGNIKLYNNANVLLATYNPNTDITIVDNEITINLTDDLDNIGIHYIKIDNNALEDADGFNFLGINDRGTIQFDNHPVVSDSGIVPADYQGDGSEGYSTLIQSAVLVQEVTDQYILIIDNSDSTVKLYNKNNFTLAQTFDIINTVNDTKPRIAKCTDTHTLIQNITTGTTPSKINYHLFDNATGNLVRSHSIDEDSTVIGQAKPTIGITDSYYVFGYSNTRYSQNYPFNKIRTHNISNGAVVYEISGNFSLQVVDPVSGEPSVQSPEFFKVDNSNILYSELGYTSTGRNQGRVNYANIATGAVLNRFLIDPESTGEEIFGQSIELLENNIIIVQHNQGNEIVRNYNRSTYAEIGSASFNASLTTYLGSSDSSFYTVHKDNTGDVATFENDTIDFIPNNTVSSILTLNKLADFNFVPSDPTGIAEENDRRSFYGLYDGICYYTDNLIRIKYFNIAQYAEEYVSYSFRSVIKTESNITCNVT